MLSYLFTIIVGYLFMSKTFNFIKTYQFNHEIWTSILMSLVFILSLVIFNMFDIEIKKNHKEHYKNVWLKVVSGIIFAIVGLVLIKYKDNFLILKIALNGISGVLTFIFKNPIDLNLIFNETIFIILFIFISLILSIIDFYTK